MMDKALLCEVSTFSFTSTLHFPDGTSQKIPTNKLAEMLAVTCNMGNYNKIKFICDNTIYIQGIIEETKYHELSQYGLNTIEYEVL